MTSTWRSSASRCAHRGAVDGGDDLHRGFGQTGGGESFAHARRDRLVARHRLRSAAQDARVAGLEAQRGRVGGDVGTRLVDDADHAERDAHLADLDAAGLELQAADLADGIAQRRDLLEALGHRRDGLGRERQAIDEGGVGAGGARGRHVARVGGDELRLVAADRGGDREQRGVLGERVGACELGGSGARGLADAFHVGADVGGAAQPGHGEIVHACIVVQLGWTRRAREREAPRAGSIRERAGQPRVRG